VPTTSAPNIIDLALTLPANTQGFLGDDEVNKPSSSKPKQTPQTATLEASRKGKEREPPAAIPEETSVSDEVDTAVDTEVEDEDSILDRQVVLTTP
jgi:hypothetical protein